MYALKKNLEQIWEQLRGQKGGRSNYLEEIQIKGLRGIRELRVPLTFPVTVLAGPNGCGKSTVLFALACAYKQPPKQPPESGSDSITPVVYKQPPDITPARIFPGFCPSKGDYKDEKMPVELLYAYVTNNARQQMKWKYGKSKWDRSFFGQKGGSQPLRETYLRTLANLTNPSELRSVIQLARTHHEQQEIDVSTFVFAQRILNYRYNHVILYSSGIRDILFAERKEDAINTQSRYSEFHMSAGERSLLRLSMRISRLNDALILIDEVEAGLHPYVQQMLMLELQRLALRNNLQIVVTTHSPVVLDTVPAEGRAFLERTEDNVVRREPYRDIIQKTLYGHSQNVLSILCEDEESEEFVRGVFDHLGPKLDFLQNDIDIGRNTGKNEFPSHLMTLSKFQKLVNVVFVLDGDGRDVGNDMEARASKLGQSVHICYLPGNLSPEEWAWTLLMGAVDRYAPIFNISSSEFQTRLLNIDNLFSTAADKPSAIAKGKLTSLAEKMAKSTGDIMRIIGKEEAKSGKGEVYDFANCLEDIVRQWRAIAL